MHKLILCGNIAKEVELTYTQNGFAILNLIIPDKLSFKNKDGKWEERTEWFYCKALGKQAETMAKCFKRGDVIWVECEKQTEEFTTKSGERKQKERYMIKEWRFVPKAYSNEENKPQQAPKKQDLKEAYERAMEIDKGIDDDDDLPF